MRWKLLSFAIVVALVLTVGGLLGASSAEEVCGATSSDGEIYPEAECHYTCSWCDTTDKACDVYGNCC